MRPKWEDGLFVCFLGGYFLNLEIICIITFKEIYEKEGQNISNGRELFPFFK